MVIRDLFRLFFPARCSACGKILPSDERYLCADCRDVLFPTSYASEPDNDVEKLFWGLVPVEEAMSLYRFRLGTTVRSIVHSIKYHHNVGLAREMGREMGRQVAQSGRFKEVDLLVPMPLHPHKARKRGYNQTLELCRGMADVLRIPICDNALCRVRDDESQTLQDTSDRADNVRNAFFVRNPKPLYGHHVLLVDDVLTTGATLSEAILPMVRLPRVKVSVATLCCAKK